MAVVLAVAACGGSTAQVAKPINVALVYATTAQDFAQEMALGGKPGAAHTSGATLIESAPAVSNGPAQVQLFTSAIRTSKDGIALETLTPDLFVNPLKDAVAAGVPVIAVDTPPMPGSSITLFVGNSNLDLGGALAKEILTQIPAGTAGEIVIGNPIPGLPPLDQRVAGIKKVLSETRPNLTLVGPLDSKLEPAANLSAWTAIVSAHPKALAFLGVGNQDPVSLAQIKKQTGRNFLVGACDLDPAALQGVKDGQVDVLVSPEHWLKGYVALRLLTEHAKTGNALPVGWWNPGALVITKTNVDDLLTRQKDASSREAWFRAEVAKQFADPTKYLRPLTEAN